MNDDTPTAADYGSTVAFKIRIMASPAKGGLGAAPKLVYRAEAHEDGDRFREQKWQCSHDHESVEQAFNCGMAWLGDQPGEAPRGRIEPA